MGASVAPMDSAGQCYPQWLDSFLSGPLSIIENGFQSFFLLRM